MNISDFNASDLRDCLIVDTGDHVMMVRKGPMLELPNRIIAYYYPMDEITLADIKNIIKADKTLPEIIGYYAKGSNCEIKLVLFRSVKNDEA